MMNNIIEIKEKVKIGNVILEAGDKIEVLSEGMDILDTKRLIIKRLQSITKDMESFYISEDLLFDNPSYRQQLEKGFMNAWRSLDTFEKDLNSNILKK